MNKKKKSFIECNLKKKMFFDIFFFLVAAAIKELRNPVLSFMGCMVRHYTMVAISQQCGLYIFLFDNKNGLVIRIGICMFGF